MTSNQFYDPVLPETYDWRINHLSQTGPSREDNTSYEGKSGTLGVMGFQGQDQPLIIELKGRILYKDEYKKFWEYRHKTNSFKFTDFEGNSYEVTMTGLTMEKIRVAWNLQDPNMRYHVWDYTMTLRILTIIAGDFAGLGIPV